MPGRPPPRGNPIAEYLRRRQVLALVNARIQELMSANEKMRGRGRVPGGREHPVFPPGLVPNPYGGPSRPSFPPGHVPNPLAGPSAPSYPPGLVPDPLGGPVMPSGPLPGFEPRHPANPGPIDRNPRHPVGPRPGPQVLPDGSLLIPRGFVGFE